MYESSLRHIYAIFLFFGALAFVYGHVGIYQPGDLYMKPWEMGVVQCTLDLGSSDFKALDGLLPSPGSFQLHAFLRIIVRGDSDMPAIKGILIADVAPSLLKSLPQLAAGAEESTIGLDPQLVLKTLPSPQDAATGVASWQLAGALRFPTSSIAIAASPSPVHADPTFVPAASQGLRFVLSALDEGPGKSCEFQAPKPAQDSGLSRLDGLGSEPGGFPTEAVVVVSPLWAVSNATAALLDRHIEHYAMLGFTGYMLYARPADLELLLTMKRVTKWVSSGLLQLVRWDAVPEHTGLPYWDQRLVYNHAVLSHLGRRTFLAMLDIDEYLVSPRREFSTVFDMVWGCTQHQPEAAVNLRIPRFHALASRWPDRSEGEFTLWQPDADADHPLFQYGLIDLKHPPAAKTIVQPDFINLFYIHTASAYRPYTHFTPASTCMLLAHLPNLFRPREDDPLRIATRFAPDPAWAVTLGRLRQQRATWLGSSGS